MSKNICIIDDFLINIKIAEMMISKHGSFDVVTSFQEAERAFGFLMEHKRHKELLPDTILLDLDMPVMSGWNFLDAFEPAIRSFSKKISVIILTSSVDERDVERSHKYSCVKGFFSKPLTSMMIDQILNAPIASAV